MGYRTSCLPIGSLTPPSFAHLCGLQFCRSPIQEPPALLPACVRPASGLPPACLRPASGLPPAASGCSKLAFDPSGYGLLHIDSGMKVTKVTVSEATLFKRGPEMDSCI